VRACRALLPDTSTSLSGFHTREGRSTYDQAGPNTKGQRTQYSDTPPPNLVNSSVTSDRVPRTTSLAHADAQQPAIMKQQQQQQQQTSSSAKVAVKTGGNHAENGHFVPSQSQTFKAPPPTVQPIASTDVAHAVRPQQFYHPCVFFLSADCNKFFPANETQKYSGHVAHYAAPQPAPFDMQYYAVATPMQYNPYEGSALYLSFFFRLTVPASFPQLRTPAHGRPVRLLLPWPSADAPPPSSVKRGRHHATNNCICPSPTASSATAASWGVCHLVQCADGCRVSRWQCHRRSNATFVDGQPTGRWCAF